MTKAITYNNAGIVEAIKLNSGSTKFYKPSFQGIIEAIQDWGGGGGGGAEIIYPPITPPTDGNDGDIIGIPNADGDWFIYIWADGSWQPLHILTTDVLPNPPGGMPGRSVSTSRPIYTPEGEELTNQQDINWYVYNNLGSEARPEMVFYGVRPPDTAPEGALFTDEDSVKQFVHQGDGVWVEVSHWTGDGEASDKETPWIRIDDIRNLRQYSGASNSDNDYVAKFLIYDYHYNDHYPSTITKEWEWDENGDGNWVTWDPYADSNVNTTWLESSFYFYYLWCPESGTGTSPIDPNHPHPCAKVRLRLVNTWDDGTFEKSDWYEVWIGKEANPTYGQPHQPPTVC